MAGYETTVVTKPGASESQNSAVKAKVESVIKADGGELVNHEDWGKRRMAFRRQNETKGHYQYFAYTGKQGSVAEIERNLRINEDVMLYLSVRVNDGSSEEDLAQLKAQTAVTAPKPPREDYRGGDRDDYRGGGGRDRGDRGDRGGRGDREGRDSRPSRDRS